MILPPVSYEGNIGCIKLTKSLNDFISCFLWGQYWLYQIDQISQWFYLLFPMRAILAVSNWPNPSMILPPVSYEGNIDCIKLTKSLNEFIPCFLWGQYWINQTINVKLFHLNFSQFRWKLHEVVSTLSEIIIPVIADETYKTALEICCYFDKIFQTCISLILENQFHFGRGGH